MSNDIDTNDKNVEEEYYICVYLQPNNDVDITHVVPLEGWFDGELILSDMVANICLSKGPPTNPCTLANSGSCILRVISVVL